MIRNGIAFILRLACGGLFVVSGYSKLTRPIEDFQYVIEQYQAFPDAIIPLIAATLPWAELIFGTFLILGFLRSFSAQILRVFCVAFVVLLWTTLWRGIDLGSCGCFGEGIHLTPKQAITIDLCLVVMLSYVAWVKTKLLELDQWLRSPHQ